MSLEDQDQLLNVSLTENERQILEDNVNEDDLAALLDGVDTNNDNNEDDAAATQQQQEEEQQQQPAYSLVWTLGETENSWLPAVLVSTNEDGSFNCVYAGDTAVYQVQDRK